MAQEVKFNHFGVPYIVEFKNISFRPNHNTPTQSHIPYKPVLSRANTIDTSRTPSPVPSYLTHRTVRSRSSSRSSNRSEWRPRPSSPVESLQSWCSIPAYEPPTPTPALTLETEPQVIGRGLYIQFCPLTPPSDAPPSYSPRPQTISRRSIIPRLRRAIANAVQQAGMQSPEAEEKHNPMESEDPETLGAPCRGKMSKALFRGTYGQVMCALKEAGLMTTPCTEAGFEKATRLGALFVVTPNDDGHVEFVKLTLWG